jgi:hypothetical protein
VFQVPSVQIVEQANSYQIRVPVQRPEDVQNINLQLEPHQIGVSGEYDLKTSDGKHSLGTSSFSKSVSTDQELDPSHVKRAVEGKTLVITIAKKEGNAPSQSFGSSHKNMKTPSSNALQEGLSPEIREQLKQQAQTSI